MLYFPEELKIDWIPHELRNEVIQKIKTYQQTSYVLKQFPDLKIKTDLLINVLSQVSDNVKIKEQVTILENILDTLDEHREVNYKTSIPWLTTVIITSKKL